MSSILIVGNVVKDVYLRLGEDQNQFEQDENGTSWLDFGFDGSSHKFFSRLAVFGGAAISLEVLSKFGIEAEIADTPANWVGGQIVMKYAPETYRYVLCQDDKVSYLSPANDIPSRWKAPNMPPSWIYLDKSAVMTAEVAEQILTYLANFSQTRLAIFVDKRTNMAADFMQSLLAKAMVIFTDTSLESERPTFRISERYIQFNRRRIAWGLGDKRNLMTDLTSHSIIAASILGALMLGKTAREALLLAQVNAEQATLNGTMDIKRLRDKIAGEDYRVEEAAEPTESDAKEASVATGSTHPVETTQATKDTSTSDQTTELRQTAKRLMSGERGILAADESGGSIHKKFEAMKITDDEQHRRDYRNIFFTTPELEKYVNGVILFDETARQKADDGTDFVTFLTKRGVIPGIKVDQGLEYFDGSNDTWTKGLVGLPERLHEYYNMGLRFAKWRAAFEIRDDAPSELAVARNAEILADYAAACQAAGLVPIVEPEVIYDGEYNIKTCAEVTGRILDKLFAELTEKKVDLASCILKVNMILAGKKSGQQSRPEEVGKFTALVLRAHVSADLAGVVFLSGGQNMEQATENLQAVTNEGPYPWPVSFSFARALQDAALNVWRGDNENTDAAREAFRQRLIANCDALVKKTD